MARGALSGRRKADSRFRRRTAWRGGYQEGQRWLGNVAPGAKRTSDGLQTALLKEKEGG